MLPFRVGGILQTPPRLPLRSLVCSFSVYSFIPYGGSVTIASTLVSGCSASHCRLSAQCNLYNIVLFRRGRRGRAIIEGKRGAKPLPSHNADCRALVYVRQYRDGN